MHFWYYIYLKPQNAFLTQTVQTKNCLQKINQFEDVSYLKSLLIAQSILHPHVEHTPIPESDPFLSSSLLPFIMRPLTKKSTDFLNSMAPDY